MPSLDAWHAQQSVMIAASVQQSLRQPAVEVSLEGRNHNTV
jgi:hypothetical protein